MSDKQEELRKLAEKKRQSAEALKHDIADSLNASERIFFLLRESLSATRAETSDSGDEGATETVSEVEGLLDTIIGNAQGASLGEIKAQRKRLVALQNVLHDMKDSLSAAELANIEKQVTATQEALDNTIAHKSTLTSRAGGFFKSNGIDIASIVAGGAGGDPIGAFIARMVGGTIEKGLATRKARKEQILSDKKALFENAKAAKVGIVPPQSPIPDEAPQTQPGEGVSGNGLTNKELEEIQRNTREMKVDIKTLVEIEEDKMAKQERESFDTLENAAEEGRKKGGLAGVLQKTKDLIDKPKSFISSVLGSVMELGREVIGGLIGGLVGAGTLTALMTTMSTAFTAAIPILIPVVLASLAGVAWYKALQELPKAWDLLMVDLKGIGKAFMNLPSDMLFEVRKLTGNLSPEEQKQEDQRQFIKSSQRVLEKKQNLEEYKKSADGFFGPNRDSQMFKNTVSMKEADIKEEEQKILADIRKQHPDASAEKLTDLYNRATMAPGDTPKSAADLGMLTTPQQDQKIYNAKVGKLRARLMDRGMSPEQIDNAVALVKKPGEAGFNNAPKAIRQAYGVSDAQVEQSAVVSQKSMKMAEFSGDGGDLPINMDSYANVLGKRESGNKYGTVNSLGFLGRYQFGKEALEDAGLLKPGASKLGSNKSVLSNPDNWTIPGGQEAFLKDNALQDQTFADFTKNNYKTLQKKGVINENTSSEDVSGYLMGAHLKGVGGVSKYVLQGQDNADAYGTRVSDYVKMGQEAESMAKASIVSPQGATPTTLALADLSAKNTELIGKQKSSTTQIYNSMTNTPKSSNNSPNAQAGSNGPVHTRPSEPTLMALQEKSMKGSVT